MDDSVPERLDRTEAPVSKAEPQSDPKEPDDFAGDKAGAGRYILSFFLAGPLGLWAVYWARYYGWRGILISLAIYIAMFIFVMIASLAAVGLAPGIDSTSSSQPAEIVDEEDLPEVIEKPEGLPTFGAPEKTIDVTQGYNAVITTDAGDIVVALSPDAPEAANSFAFLASQNFYDGLQFFWVLPEFNTQTGDPTCTSSSEFSCTGTGDPGYTLPKEGDSATTSQWTVIAPVTTPGGDRVHGSQFVIALADGEFEGTAFGEVVEGQEILEALQQRVPCFGSLPSESNPCQTDEELPAALTIVDIAVQPA